MKILTLVFFFSNWAVALSPTVTSAAKPLPTSTPLLFVKSTTSSTPKPAIRASNPKVAAKVKSTTTAKIALPTTPVAAIEPAAPQIKTTVNYQYEVNTAPAALIANWYSVDLIKYTHQSETTDPYAKFGIGLAIISYIRNNNDFDNTFPSRQGYAGGLTAIWDYKESYYATHAFYEKYERYTDGGSLKQDREGFRVNVVVGGKEYFKRNYALKFGWGLEIQSYQVKEFDEKFPSRYNNYNTLIFNPLYLELKLSGLF